MAAARAVAHCSSLGWGLSVTIPIRRQRACIGWINGAVRKISIDLIAPTRPSRDALAREDLQVRPWTAPFDQMMGFLRLARMLSLAGFDNVGLAPAGRQRTHL